MRRQIGWAVALGLVLSATAAWGSPSYQITDLGKLSQVFTQDIVGDINNAGQVIYNDNGEPDASNIFPIHGVVVQPDGTRTQINAPDGNFSILLMSINDSGKIVANAFVGGGRQDLQTTPYV